MNVNQLRAMLWLRWRLTRNQWQRGGNIGAVITLVLSIVGGGLVVSGGIAGLVGGAWGLSQASPEVTRLAWDGLVVLFLLLWAIGIVTDLQRSEIIDSSRLLHLPVSLRDVFLLNYLASHLSLSLAMMLPAMLGLAAGLVLGRGAAMLLLFPLVFTFFYMITAWTYCLRGWLAALMVNKRRRRAIIMGITMAVVLLAQLPNLVTNFWLGDRHAAVPQTVPPVQHQAERDGRNGEAVTPALDMAHRCVPFLWLPQGARALAAGHVWPAVWGSLGMLAIGTWGLVRAYRGTIRFYQGKESGKPARAPSVAETSRAGRKILVERTLPAIPEQSAAMAMAGFRSMCRAPEVKMALATNVVIFAIFGASILLRRTTALPATAQSFVASAAVAMTMMGLVQLMFNHFGFDRNGFRALVLLPTLRRRILLGKNLALLPVALAVFAVCLGLATVLARLGLWDILTAGFEFAGAFLALSVVGNITSILVPYRVAPGSLRATKTKGLTQLLIFATHLLFPLALAPVFLPAVLGLLGDQLNWLPGRAVALGCAATLAALAGLLYWRTLEPIGRLLQRREQAILQVVTQEVE